MDRAVGDDPVRLASSQRSEADSSMRSPWNLCVRASTAVATLLAALCLSGLANFVDLANPSAVSAGTGAVVEQAAPAGNVIDTHIHIFDPARPGGIAWPPPGHALYHPSMPADFAAIAGPAGVTGAVIIEASPVIADNDWMLDVMENEPSLLGYVGFLRLASEEFADNLAGLATHPRFVGIRGAVNKASLDDPRTMAALRDLQSRNLTLDISGPTEISLLEVSVVAAALPDLHIVIDHLGNKRIDGTAPDSVWISGIQALSRHPNVYMKISGLYQNAGKEKPALTDVGYYAPMLDVVWDGLGEDRLLYGSNWPVTNLYGEYGPNVDIVRSYFATKGAVALEKVMWLNAVKAYSLTLTQDRPPGILNRCSGSS